MKVSYRKTFNNDGSVNRQAIKIENGEELLIISDLLKECEKEWERSFSLPLSVTMEIRKLFNNERIKILY